MQDEVNEKTIALYIKTGKLTAQTLQKAMKAILSKGKKQLAKPPQGKQSLKQLMKQNAGVSNIEITEGNIKAFESTAKKYGIDFALKKDATESPPRYLVFFKGRDADVLTAAFKEFSAKKLTQEKKPSIRKLLSTLKEAAQGKNAERAKYPLGSYPLLRRKSDFAKLPQKKNAAISKKITTLSKSCSVLSRTFLFALFFDFGNLFCRCGHNPYACIAHTVKERVKLPPLCVLCSGRV